jgi:hypothetical protein
MTSISSSFVPAIFKARGPADAAPLTKPKSSSRTPA